MVEALNKYTTFAADPDNEKSKIKDVFNTVLRTAIIYDDESNSNWKSMWDLLQVQMSAVIWYDVLRIRQVKYILHRD